MGNFAEYKNQSFDVIIQGGQSNAQGCGLGAVSEEYVPDPDILYMEGDFSVSTADVRIDANGQKVGDFSLSFAREYKRSGRLAAGRKILILRSAVGGTGWSDHRWGMGDDLYLRMMEMIRRAREFNADNRLIALLWHQGESDTGSGFDVHYAHLKALVDSVRSEFSAENLPFIAADCVNDEWKELNRASAEPIFAAVKAVCRDLGNGGFIETTDLESNGKAVKNYDTIHFSRGALEILGKRYFAEYERIAGTK